MLGMSAASILVYVLTAVCLTIHDATKVTYDGSGIEFAVHYDVDNCTENPGLKGWKDYLVPCGLSSRLYVVIAPCPAMPRDPSCCRSSTSSLWLPSVWCLFANRA